MEKKRTIRLVGYLLLVLSFALTACGGANATPEVIEAPANGSTTEETTNGATEVPAAPEATPTDAERFPEILVLHPDATDIQANPASGTYLYIVPMMVQETNDYLLEAMKALGWEELGRPVVMGHLATLNMQMNKTRVTISMQDNERSQTTRVQMLLLEQ